MGNWRHSRGWRFCPKTFRRNDLHTPEFFWAESSKSSLRPAFQRPHFPQETAVAAIANGISGLVPELSAPRQPRPDGSLSSDDWRLRIWPEITSRFQCIRHTPCTDGSRHTECAGYILLWV